MDARQTPNTRGGSAIGVGEIAHSPEDSAIEVSETPNKQDGSAISVWETADTPQDSAIEGTETPHKQDGSAISVWETADTPQDSAIESTETPHKQDDSAIGMPEAPHTREDSAIGPREQPNPSALNVGQGATPLGQARMGRRGAEGQRGRGRREFETLRTSAPLPHCGENERPKRHLELGSQESPDTPEDSATGLRPPASAGKAWQEDAHSWKQA